MTPPETETPASSDFDWLSELRSQAVRPASSPSETAPEATLPEQPDSAGELWAIRSLSGGVGRTVIALNLAFEAARLGKRVCLLDLDSKNPSLHVFLNVQNPKTAVLAGIRLASQNRLDEQSQDSLLIEVEARDSSVDLATSSAMQLGHDELGALELWLRSLQTKYDLIVADTEPGIHSGLHALLDKVAARELFVVAAEPVGLERLFSAQHRLVGGGQNTVLFNRVRSAVVGANPSSQLKALMQRHGVLDCAGFVPEESEIYDLAQHRGVPLRMVNAKAKSVGVLSELLGGRSRSIGARRHRG